MTRYEDSLRRLATQARRALLSAAFAVMAITALVSRQAAAQSGVVNVWVDPVNAVDPSATQQALWIDDPDKMFKTLQRAIDVVLEQTTVKLRGNLQAEFR